MKTAFSLAALVGYAAAECPNACSGHGTCGAKDSCSCYQNYQGNDCSERTCYFGLAHVDSPKGDLNADGKISGPLTTVITGSEVYPWGTTEQFPNANSNEGHFYMECSNKGLCDRKSGTCDCFDGYTGTACARAACPNDCSGHGTCESIKELAEMRSFDTNAHHASGTRAANSNSGQDYSAAIEESYSYDLWDADKTMGCKCDPVYYGADCSLKKCKYGVDPLYYDSTDGAIHQTTVVHLGSVGGYAGNAGSSNTQTIKCDGTGGSFKLTHGGETTAAIAFDATAAATQTAFLLLSTVGASTTVVFGTGKTAACDAGGTNTITIDFVDLGTEAQLTSDAALLTGGAGTVTHATTNAGELNSENFVNRYPKALTGTFKIVFYDVFGEKYVTKDISAANSLTPLAVRDALEALPNGVISNENTDVTGLAPAACTVAMQSLTGDITTSGGIGAGASGSDTAVGAGLGTQGHVGEAHAGTTSNGVGSGPEFTVTFTTNPGILKSIELDTRNVGNTGVADYWVANSRQGQFNSRYTTNLGRVNTLLYGSTKLYTNTDLTGSVVGAAADASLVKVGGQEFQVIAENAAFLTLSEPFLGNSITATLTATGAELGSSHTFVDHGTLGATAAAKATAFDGATNTMTTDQDFSNAAFVGTWFKFSGNENIGSVGGVAQTTCQGKLLSATATPTKTITLAPGHTCVTTTAITNDGTNGDGTTKIADGQFVAATTTKAAEISVVGVDTEIVVQHLKEGSALSVGGCSFTVSKFGTGTGSEIALYGHTLGAGGGALGVDNNFDCNPQNGKGRTQGAAIPSIFYGEFGAPGTIVYRRTDDPNNQNVYKAPSDAGSQISSNLMLTRGNSAAYLVDGGTGGGTASATVHTSGSEAFTTAASTGTAGEVFFVNGRGPMVIKTAAATAIAVDNAATGFGKFFPRATAAATASAAIAWPVQMAISTDADRTGSTAVVAGSVLLLDGRRYRVKARGANVAGVNGMSKVTLSENYAGGSLEKVCDTCLAVTTKADGKMKTFSQTSGGAGALLNLVAGDRVLQGDNLHGDLLTTVASRPVSAAATTGPVVHAVVEGTEFVNSGGGAFGTMPHLSTTNVDLTDTTGKALYKTRYGAKGAAAVTVITEVAAGANTYKYVAQCANRGTCDSATGVCKCFKGYAGDNCAKQNMLAM